MTPDEVRKAVTEAQVRQVCEQLAQADGKAEFRKVYALTGGNHTNVLQWWRTWQADYEPQLLPATFHASLQRFLDTDVWEARYQELTRTLVPEAEARVHQLESQCAQHDATLAQLHARISQERRELAALHQSRQELQTALREVVYGTPDDPDGSEPGPEAESLEHAAGVHADGP